MGASKNASFASMRRCIAFCAAHILCMYAVLYRDVRMSRAQDAQERPLLESLRLASNQNPLFLEAPK